MEEEKKRRFGVLQCCDDSEYVRKMYGGYFKVFASLLAEESEIWEGFMVLHGHFPQDDELDSYDGFVITGSCTDAHGGDQWVDKLIQFLRRLDSMKIKVLGFCFGHQILCRALGGKTGRAIKGWDIGVKCIHPLASNNLFSSLQLPSHVTVIKCHQDEVLELPPKAELLARSDKTNFEMFRYGQHILGIQGHPEYSLDILLNLLDRMLQRGYIESEEVDVVKARLGTKEPNREAWKRLCSSFLRGKLLS